MTLATTTNKIICAGNDVTTSFTYDFKILEEGDERVVHTDDDGVETTLTRGTAADNYTISGTGEESGGTVTYPNSGTPVASGETITIIRDVDYTQDTSLSNQGAFYPTAVETALDRIVMMIQKLQWEAGF